MTEERGDHAGRIGVPLRMAPMFDPKPWGGRRLEKLGKVLPDGLIGESLESGSEARVIGGRFDSYTLAQMVREYPSALLGRRGCAVSAHFNDFPLLIKFIDAAEDLSVQVHPDDAHAPPGKRGKSEAWLIIAAEPGARLVTGLSGPVDESRIQDQLIETPVSPGDVFIVPAGTVHAIGAGVMLYEIQQASDVTYRLFDWGRDREMHVEQARDVAVIGQSARVATPVTLAMGRELLVACEHFVLERWTVSRRTQLPRSEETFRVVSVLHGWINVNGQRFDAGETAVLPADMPESDLAGSGVMLVGYLPDLERDVIAPLRQLGVADDAIRGLGVSLP